MDDAVIASNMGCSYQTIREPIAANLFQVSNPSPSNPGKNLKARFCFLKNIYNSSLLFSPLDLNGFETLIHRLKNNLDTFAIGELALPATEAESII